MISATMLGLEVRGYSSGEALVLCPWHNDTSPSAWYNERKGLFYCSVCGFGKNIAQVVERTGVEIDDEDMGNPLPGILNLFIEAATYPMGFRSCPKYVWYRGVSPSTAIDYDLHTYEDAANGESVVFHHKDNKGKVIGVTHRFVTPVMSGSRYKHYGELAPVWPMQLLKDASDCTKTIVIVEGPFSAMRLHTQWGVAKEYGYHALALFGAKANQSIVDTLRPFRRVVYLYDGDEAGRRACRKMRTLDPTRPCHTLKVSPDDMSVQSIIKLTDKLEGMFNEHSRA